jgi:hypothetical protein
MIMTAVAIHPTVVSHPSVTSSTRRRPPPCPLTQRQDPTTSHATQRPKHYQLYHRLTDGTSDTTDPEDGQTEQQTNFPS